jgi:plasmid rolling circle replication initiator protein Rep
MIIHLSKSKLFTEEPDFRFSKEYALPRGFWTELWRKHLLLGYTPKDLADYYEFKTHKSTTPQSMQRWIWRTQVYMKARGVIKMGCEVVQSDFFGENEYEVVKELTKNLKGSVKKEAKILI